MKCIGKKCPLYFESDSHGSCKINNYVCEDITMCDIDVYVRAEYDGFINLEITSEIVRHNQKGEIWKN